MSCLRAIPLRDFPSVDCDPSARGGRAIDWNLVDAAVGVWLNVAYSSIPCLSGWFEFTLLISWLLQARECLIKKRYKGKDGALVILNKLTLTLPARDFCLWSTKGLSGLTRTICHREISPNGYINCGVETTKKYYQMLFFNWCISFIITKNLLGLSSEFLVNTLLPSHMIRLITHIYVFSLIERTIKFITFILFLS